MHIQQPKFQLQRHTRKRVKQDEDTHTHTQRAKKLFILTMIKIQQFQSRQTLCGELILLLRKVCNFSCSNAHANCNGHEKINV